MSSEEAGPLTIAVAAALAARPVTAVDPRDAALEALALSYARLMDEPAPAGKYADAVEWLHQLLDVDAPTHPKTRRNAQQILTALSEHTVHSDLGPKLQACLESLRLSPKVRLIGKGVAADGPDGAKRSKLDELRARRDRKHNPPPVDTPAP